MSKYGIREVTNVVIKNLTTQKPVLFLETLKTQEITGSANVVSAIGGRGAVKQLTWSAERDIQMKMSDALLDINALTVQCGAVVATGAISAHKKEVFTIGTTTGAAVTGLTLTEIPVTGTVGADKYIAIVTDGTSLGTELTWSTAGTGTGFYTFTGTHIAFGTSAVATGNIILTDYYYTSTSTTKRISINADSFADYYSLEGETLWRDNATKTDKACLYTIPKLRFKDSFKIDAVSSGEPVVIDFEADVFPTSPSDSRMVLIDILE
jgi:hypothetical protein